MAFQATFNNISVISWQSVLLVEETEVPEKNHVFYEMGKVYTYYQIYAKKKSL